MAEDKAILDEIKRIKKHYADIGADAMTSHENAIRSLAFIRVEKRKLEDFLQENGWACEFQQSDKVPPMPKVRPEADQFHKLEADALKREKQLDDLLPSQKADSTAKAGEALAAFVARGK